MESRRLKIGIAIDAVHRVGGTQRSTWEIAACLGQDHDVTLIAKEGSATGGELFKVHIVQSFLVRLPYLGNVFFAWNVSRLKKILKLDILAVQGTNGLYQDVITAQSVHKKWFLWSLARTKPLSKAWWLKILNPMHYVVILLETLQYSRWCHKKVIAISRQVQGDLERYFGLSPDRIAVVHHGVNTSEFSPDQKAAARIKVREKLQLSEDDFVVIFVAHEFRRKGLSVLLKALTKLKTSTHLIVAGKDDPTCHQQEAESLGIKSQVHFVGSQSNLSEWYAASDVFAFPTSYEAFGMVITEAMAAGLPVVVPKDAGAAELIRSGEGGYLMDHWGDDQALASYLEALSDPDHRQTMSMAARKVAELRTWQNAAEETLAVYRSVL